MRGGGAVACAARKHQARRALAPLLWITAGAIGIWALAAAGLFAATTALRVLAYAPIHRGDYTAAWPYVSSLVALDEAAATLRIPGQRKQLAEDLLDLGETLGGLCRREEAIARYERSLALYRELRIQGTSHEQAIRWRQDRLRRESPQRCAAATARPPSSDEPYSYWREVAVCASCTDVPEREKAHRPGRELPRSCVGAHLAHRLHVTPPVGPATTQASADHVLAPHLRSVRSARRLIGRPAPALRRPQPIGGAHLAVSPRPRT